ncbi:MAG: EEP domain-containing protein, partial [Bdellovibrionaceae bacterium]|nr:EEP domain-containing protein [Bdellovibrio sp.]
MKLKILSYNIHKGFDWGKRNYFLQEVVGQSDKYKEKGLIDTQFEFLADSIWEHYSYARNAL